ncbi:MAG: NAD(P)/FAD-dependent oxidoreductase [Rhizobiales bacterium]|nr:NAD(P)/FAD-dependent oxidoreductase [Hyphomicrobiales bacterium]NRB15483.1 NAD(P)/FAD-dependent oxidoreductase [Hyphomicrobiales bacterium]
MTDFDSDFNCDVAIIGSGPAGIGAATALAERGVKNITIFEREEHIGGIPRHTKHLTFGLVAFKRPMTGPAFIKKILARCKNVTIRTNISVIAIKQDSTFEVATAQGLQTVKAKHIILATGARESTRHARLVSGMRPRGIVSTAALQQFIYSFGARPFNQAVVVGTELVSFSAIWTLWRAKIKPVAMIERNHRITAYRPAVLLAKILRVPIYYNSQITNIESINTLKAVSIMSDSGVKQVLNCDGIIFSGKFVGENSLAVASHLLLNPQTDIPFIDENWQTSDSDVTVIGNAVHPADMGDQCYLEGLKLGSFLADKLAQNTVNSAEFIPIEHSSDIKMTTPNMVRLDNETSKTINICFHVSKIYWGLVTVKFAGKTVYKKRHRCMPARRITLKNIRLDPFDINDKTSIEICFS